MQFVPEAPDLLAAIGKLLDEKVLSAVPADLQHQVRVAAHLSTLVERELRLGPGNTIREDDLLAALLGARVADPQAVLADRIRHGDDEAFETDAWVAVVEITRQDLAVAKPGHDHWEGELMTIDLAAGLATYLGEAWGQDVTISNLSASTAGARRHNVLFEAAADGVTHHLVATIVPFGETIINSIDAEAAVRDVAEKGGVAVPHVHLVRNDGDLVGGPFMISEFVPGETVPRRVLRLIVEHGIGETVAAQLGESLAKLHAIDPASVAVPLRVREFEGPPAVAALAGLRAAVDELPLPRPALELGLRWLGRRLPAPPDHETIVHSDTRNGNLIIGEDGLRAVLDWEGTLASGDPMQDLAWPSLRMWRFRNDTKEIGGFADRAPFIAGYESVGGTFDAARFHWWKVEGTLRWAVGLAGQTMGFLEGRVPSIVMAASGRRVPELEWDLLMLIRP